MVPRLIFAQGENNITGVTGGFNGWVTSAGMYDPYAGGPFYRQKDRLKGTQLKAAHTLRACS